MRAVAWACVGHGPRPPGRRDERVTECPWLALSFLLPAQSWASSFKAGGPGRSQGPSLSPRPPAGMALLPEPSGPPTAPGVPSGAPQSPISFMVLHGLGCAHPPTPGGAGMVWSVGFLAALLWENRMSRPARRPQVTRTWSSGGLPAPAKGPLPTRPGPRSSQPCAPQETGLPDQLRPEAFAQSSFVWRQSGRRHLLQADTHPLFQIHPVGWMGARGLLPLCPVRGLLGGGAGLQSSPGPTSRAACWTVVAVFRL